MMSAFEALGRLRGAAMVAVAIMLAACGSDAPSPPVAPAEPSAIAELVQEETSVDPNALVPDASIEAVVVDANTTATVAGDQGLVPTPEAPVIEVVAYEDLAFVVGERVIVRTSLGSTREGILKRYFNTGLKVLVNERGREMELDMPRNTVDEVKVVWTHSQGTPAAMP